MAITRDTLYSQIPGHIIESYPRFVDFLEAYYEWLNIDGNPYERIKNHMSYLDFQKSMDDYVSAMTHEYLSDVPENVLIDKELFIKWSKKFNLARGSHASYKFLFRILFNEQDTSIYLPKENVLRTSDGEWVSGERKFVLTSTNSVNDFIFQTVTQTRELGPGNVETATATVQSAVKRYYGNYQIIELSVTNIVGEFKLGWTVDSPLGASEWPIPTIDSVEIVSRGTNNQIGDRLEFSAPLSNVVVRDASIDGSFDTRLTTFFSSDVLDVQVNGNPVTNFEFDGRYVTSAQISAGDEVQVTLPGHSGYVNISEIGQHDDVIAVDILEPAIGLVSDETMTTNNYGQGFEGLAISGITSKVNGYYKNNKGQLSSNMYLQDSFYYQDYSYAIKTQENIDAYSKTVQDLLHPSGFLMFGNLQIIELIELIIGLEYESLETVPQLMESRAKYTLGPNYSFLDRFKAGLSKRLYSMYHFIDKDWEWNQNFSSLYMDYGIIEAMDEYLDDYTSPYYMDDGIIEDVDTYIQVLDDRIKYLRFDMEMVNGGLSYITDGETGDVDYITDDYINETYFATEVSYNLEDSSLERTYLSGGGAGYFKKDYLKDLYFELSGQYTVLTKGWMTKHYLSDSFMYIPQDYSLETESGFQYFETGYVSERDV